MKISIEKIRIMERIRKEINKIDELSADIKRNGLVNPVTVMPLDGGEFRLLAGLRRIKAAQSLGWTEIEVSVVSSADAEAALRIEISENEQREPFTFSEKVDFCRLLEEIETAKARERMSVGGKGGMMEGVHFRAPLKQGKRRDIIGAKIGMSGYQYDCVKYIAENAPPEIIEQLDKGERTIRGAYDELRAKEKAQAPAMPREPAKAELKPKSKRKAEAKTKTQGKKPTTSPKSAPTTTYRIPKQRPLSARDQEAARKLSEYHALPPEAKIEELNRQLRELRGRAVTAESDLARQKELRANDVGHRDSIIDSLKRQLADAHARIEELEDLYEPGQHTRTNNLSLLIGGAQ